MSWWLPRLGDHVASWYREYEELRSRYKLFLCQQYGLETAAKKK